MIFTLQNCTSKQPEKIHETATVAVLALDVLSTIKHKEQILFLSRFLIGQGKFSHCHCLCIVFQRTSSMPLLEWLSLNYLGHNKLKI
jgi:hypothetical protein